MARTATKPTRLSPMEASFDRLSKLAPGSRSLHYKVAKECSILLKDEEYLSNKRKNNERLDKELENILPGMSKTTLERMYDVTPKRADWDSLGFIKVRKAAFDSLVEEPREKATGEPAAEQSKASKKINRFTGGENLGGGVGGLKVSELQEMRDQIASLTAENAELRQSRDEAWRRIGELEMEIKKLKG